MLFQSVKAFYIDDFLINMKFLINEVYYIFGWRLNVKNCFPIPRVIDKIFFRSENYYANITETHSIVCN